MCWWPEVEALHIVRVDAPSAVSAGTDHSLHCDYDLNGTSLYVLRWYKDDQEFFRYMPKEAPAKRNFHVAGVQVNVTFDFLFLIYLFIHYFVFYVHSTMIVNLNLRKRYVER